jgi:hypothetical protein
MRGRLGLVLGLGAGYVLGAKAGQQRYEEIRDGFNKLMGTEQAQQLQTQVRTAAEKAGQVIEEKASDGVAKVSEMVGSGGSSSNNGGSTTPDGGIVLPPT